MLIDSRARLGWVVVTVGGLTAALFALADALGFGYGGFGRVQSLGLVWGLIVVSLGGLFVYRGPSESDVRLVAAFGVAVVMMLVASALIVRVISRPAYEATAEMVIDPVRDPGPCPQAQAHAGCRGSLTDARILLVSPHVAQLASSIAANLDGPNPTELFAWYGPGSLSTDCPGCVLDAGLIEKNLRIKIGKDREASQIFVVFRADNPAVAQVGANLVVEAYGRIIAPGGPYPPVAQLSLAPAPARRADALAWGDVLWFLLVSSLAVYVTWRWWPTSGIQSDFVLVPAVVVALVAGVFWGYLWLVALAFVVGLLSVSGPIARYPDGKLPIERETG